MTTIAAPTITYCTLARIGYWASLDAKIETWPSIEASIRAKGGQVGAPSDDILIPSHLVDFVLIGRDGERLWMGYSIISQYDDEDFGDENGDAFPSLDAAIRAHADGLLAVTPMPGQRISKQPRHDLATGQVGTAFPKVDRVR